MAKIDFRDENGDPQEKSVTLIGRKLHLIRGEVDAGPIVLTDTGRDETGWYQILDVSKDCRIFDASHVGKWVYLEGINVGESYMVGPGERVVRETWFGKAGGPPLAVFEEVA
jgi:hypothetical protein